LFLLTDEASVDERTRIVRSVIASIAGGKLLLYTVGWNETDDGGQDGGDDFTKGDWVWEN